MVVTEAENVLAGYCFSHAVCAKLDKSGTTGMLCSVLVELKLFRAWLRGTISPFFSVKVVLQDGALNAFLLYGQPTSASGLYAL